MMFLAVTWQLNRWPCHSLSHSVTQWLSDSVSHFLFLTLKSDPRDLWPLRHLITVMRKHDLTNFLTIFDDNFWWQFWWQFFMTIFYDNFWWQFLMIIFDCSDWVTEPLLISDLWKNFRFSENTMTLRLILETCDLRLDSWDTDYISDNWEQQY